MKISCIPICFFRDIIQTRTMSVESWIEMASELGLDGIEMYKWYLTSWEEDYISGLSHAVRDAGLEVSMFTSYADFSAFSISEIITPIPMSAQSRYPV